MARSMPERMSGSKCSMVSGVSCASSIDAEAHGVCGIAFVREVAEEEPMSSNSWKASESSFSRVDGEDAGGRIRSSASRWRGRCCAVDVDDVAEALGT